MSIFDDIRADAEAGTPGTWGIADGSIYPTVRGGIDFISEHVCAMSHYRSEREAEQYPNARRIARVPDLERIALAAEELAKVFPDIVGYLEGLIEDGCPKCGGDCAGANPPVAYCPMKSMSNDLEKARSALAAFQDTTR